MDRSLAVVLTACTGGLIALQAPINSMLGKAVGPWQAALVSFAVGTLVKEVMEGALQLEVPLVVEASIGRSWAEVH